MTMKTGEVHSVPSDITGTCQENDVKVLKTKLAEAILQGAAVVSYNPDWIESVCRYATYIHDTTTYRAKSSTPDFLSSLVIPTVMECLQARAATVDNIGLLSFEEDNDDGHIKSHQDNVVGQGVSLLVPFAGHDAMFSFSEKRFRVLPEDIETTPGVAQVAYGLGRFIVLRQRMYVETEDGDYRDYQRVHHHGRSDSARGLLTLDIHTQKMTRLADLV